mmetsp:Transcript_30368/g.54358  ORF Transcript_30368/g.54358 Transcript_30368/m.54358 type:complete len:283 (-) Transcript_30368:1127-1975(-)
MHVRPVRIPRASMQVVILLDYSFQLPLDVGYLGRGKAILCYWHPSSSEVVQETKLLRQQEQQRLALALGSPRRAPDSVDVLRGHVRRIVLDDPVDFGNVQAPSGYICAKHDAFLGSAKGVVRGAPGSLLLVPVDAGHGQVDVVQELVVEFHRVASREENHHLLVAISLQEGEQEQKSALGRANHVALSEPGDSRNVVLGLHFDKYRLVQRQPRQICNFSRLRRREESRLPLLRQEPDDHVHLLLKPYLQTAVSLVNGQVHQIVVNKPLGVLHVIQEPPRRGN